MTPSKPLTALLLACAATPAVASDPWSVAEGVNGISVSSDASTLTCASAQCSIWEETRYSVTRSDGGASLRDLALYDCASNRTRTKMEIKFGADGRALKTVTGEDAWLPAPEGSVGAITLAFACNFQAANGEEVRSGAFAMAGHRFVRLSVHDQLNDATEPDPPGGGPSPLAVQIAASQTEKDAMGATARFEGKYQGELSTGLELTIMPVTLQGGQIFRVLVEGFKSESEAYALCEKLKSDGDDCLVRSSLPSAAPER
jgi:hypothetical protein